VLFAFYRGNAHSSNLLLSRAAKSVQRVKAAVSGVGYPFCGFVPGENADSRARF
jgi:hypothetical protein